MKTSSKTAEDELADYQRRFQVLEGDRKSYYETSQWTIKQNKETIAAVKKENKELRAQLSKLNSGKSSSAVRAEEDEEEEYIV